MLLAFVGKFGQSRPARGEWIENLSNFDIGNLQLTSRPARGEWIENLKPIRPINRLTVSPRKGRVD